ncbi:hypothetical protein BDY17DRAFT_21021 [Neohortaea acidophila]|uniref:Uncharacterized protein n=1 Tax=Neohortaea acidophila TaxID=245834 RepID=A0A6A6Q7F2_9PEZI|nr:uncharacterized protein BDY17DRAFT_21021 [Neohortaea acidophila]KAF2487924.1 hypothetical protein BDY17DRAFT_21021 [Neohortaea acidophila]
MSSKDSHLYNQRPHNLKHGKEISSSNSLSFTSHLSSLINAPTARPSKPTSARLKPKKDDLFRKPNRNTAKRAKLDLDDSADSPAFQQKHTTDGEGVDSELLRRSRKKMEEKARLYAAMKRGDVDDVDEKYTVDFDRKWTDAYDANDKDNEDDDDDDSEFDETDREIITYTDEFGRTRTGTRLEAARVRRAMAAQEDLQSDKYTARPSAPVNIIRGDTIQHAAFQPDAVIVDQMEALARKRDSSLTPPPEEHFDGRKEVRSKGTGFFHFSGDGDERKRQMEGLEAERAETERVRSERGKRKADAFLDELGAELDGRGTAEDGNAAP